MLLDLIVQCFGGGGGNRTRVRKSSAVSSTYLVTLLNLISNYVNGQTH